MLKRLAKTSMAHIRMLSEEIGPRPAGSGAEAQARAYVAKLLTSAGYTVETQPFKFAALPKFNMINLIGGVIMIAGALYLAYVPWLAILMPFVVLVLPQLNRWLYWNRTPTEPSENVVGYLDRKEDTPTLLLCAHLDSARARATHSELFLWLVNQTNFIYQRVSIAIALVAVVVLLGIPLPAFVFAIIGVAGVLTGAWVIFSEIANQFFHRNRYSPGANDNASGVGVLLALADHYATQPPKHLRLGFLFTGAEETGMHGARAFAQQLIDSDRAQSTYVLNVDMVGMGDALRVITKDGVISPQRTDERMNNLLFENSGSARAKWYIYMSGDHYPFAKNNIPATALQLSRFGMVNTTYHSNLDTHDKIKVDSLTLVLDSIINFIRTFENNIPD